MKKILTLEQIYKIVERNRKRLFEEASKIQKKSDFESVGKDGVNKPEDVKHILDLFSNPKVGMAKEVEAIIAKCSPKSSNSSEAESPSELLDAITSSEDIDYAAIGKCAEFYNLIKKYQKEEVFSSGFSDSRIDPDRETITMLYNTILGTNAEAKEETPEAKEETLEAKVKLSGNKYENIAIKKYGNEFVDKVKSIGENVGLDYKMILAIMYFESGINHKAVNSQSKATGLIQFMPSTAQALGTTIGELRSMTALKQLDYVKKFFNLNKSLIPYIKSPEDVYFLVFYPLATKKDDSFILGSEISDKRARLIAKQNPVDTNKDGYLSKGEIKAKVRQRLGI